MRSSHAPPRSAAPPPVPIELDDLDDLIGTNLAVPKAPPPPSLSPLERAFAAREAEVESPPQQTPTGSFPLADYESVPPPALVQPANGGALSDHELDDPDAPATLFVPPSSLLREEVEAEHEVDAADSEQDGEDKEESVPGSQRQKVAALDDGSARESEPPPESGEVESQRYALAGAGAGADADADETPTPRPIVDVTAEVRSLGDVEIAERQPAVRVEVASFRGSVPKRLSFGELLDRALDLADIPPDRR